MDDSLIVDINKEKLKKTLKIIQNICEKYKIILNKKKTIVSKNRCSYLQRQWINTNKLIVKPKKDSYYRMFRKLKIFFRWFKAKRLTLENIETSYQSWRSHFLKDNSKLLVNKANLMYNKLKEQYL